MNIILVGFMGCGKSTVGRKLAERGGREFVDLDKEVCSLAQAQSVEEIFRLRGEEEFRRLEHQAIVQLAGRDNMVVATGGGAPCWGDNMALLGTLGTTVYLRMDAHRLRDRLLRVYIPRPKIAGMDAEQLLAYVTELLEEREPIYSRARVVVDCNQVEVKDVVRRLGYLLK